MCGGVNNNNRPQVRPQPTAPERPLADGGVNRNQRTERPQNNCQDTFEGARPQRVHKKKKNKTKPLQNFMKKIEKALPQIQDWLKNLIGQMGQHKQPTPQLPAAPN